MVELQDDGLRDAAEPRDRQTNPMKGIYSRTGKFMRMEAGLRGHATETSKTLTASADIFVRMETVSVFTSGKSQTVWFFHTDDFYYELRDRASSTKVT